MATLSEYFATDFSNALTQGYGWQTATTPQFEIPVKVGLEVYSSAKFVAYYVAPMEQQFSIVCSLIDLVPNAITQSESVQIVSGMVGEIRLGAVGNCIFANRVYVYLEGTLTDDEKGHLNAICQSKSLWLSIRGPNYLTERMKLEKPLAFICHDSRDKTDIAMHVAVGLQKLMCPVWYDEYSLGVGDHLRESIEKGLKETKKCILIITQNFLSNSGWTKTEFNSVFTRELLERASVILPVWRSVSAKDVYEYSPSLADRLALDWDRLGQEEVVRRLYGAIMSRIQEKPAP